MYNHVHVHVHILSEHVSPSFQLKISFIFFKGCSETMKLSEVGTKLKDFNQSLKLGVTGVKYNTDAPVKHKYTVRKHLQTYTRTVTKIIFKFVYGLFGNRFETGKSSCSKSTMNLTLEN